eukprot:1494518-Lingulodinium_polyedra.AAC.1
MREERALRHKHRGRVVSVTKFRKETGKCPDASKVFVRKSRSGRLKECTKIYAHSDSSSWSFEEEDADIVEKDTLIDDGSIILNDNQMRTKYDATCTTIFGGEGKKSSPTATKS